MGESVASCPAGDVIGTSDVGFTVVTSAAVGAALCVVVG